MSQAVQIQIDALLDGEKVSLIGDNISYGSNSILTSGLKVFIAPNTIDLQIVINESGDFQSLIITSPQDSNGNISVKIDNSTNHEFAVNPVFLTSGLTSGSPLNLYFSNTSATNTYEINIEGVAV